jgi:hypothetical protein
MSRLCAGLTSPFLSNAAKRSSSAEVPGTAVTLSITGTDVTGSSPATGGSGSGSGSEAKTDRKDDV